MRHIYRVIQKLRQDDLGFKEQKLGSGETELNGWYFHVFVTNNPKSLSTNKVYFLSEIKFSVNFSIDPLKQFSVLCRSTARETMAANRCMKHRNNRSNCSKSSYFVTYIFYKNHFYCCGPPCDRGKSWTRRNRKQL